MPTAKTKKSVVKKNTSSPKKSVAARVAKSPTTVVSVENPSVSPQASQGMPFKVKKKTLAIGLIVIAVLGLAVYFRNVFVVAVVNGQPISRLSYINETEAVYLSDARVTAGKQALNQLVTKTLIYQEASKRNIVISDKEVDAEVATVRKTVEKSQKLEDALAAQGDTLKAYRERIRIQKMLEKLVGKVTVVDKDVTDYIEKNKSTLPQDLSEAELKKQVRSSLEQQKFSEKVQTLITDLQKKAKVSYMVQ